MRGSPLGVVLFLALAIGIVGGFHYYLYLRLIRALDLGASTQRVGMIAFIVLALLTPAGMALTRALSRPYSSVVAWIVYLWMGLAILLFFSLLGSEVVRVAVLGIAKLKGEPLDEGRRAALSRGIAGVVSLLALGLAGAGLSSAIGPVEVKRTKIDLERLPIGLAGFRIVQISDVHIGPTLGRGFLEEVVERVNACDADLIAITGDLVDGSVESLRDQVAPLGNLKAKHGVYFVTGNHEYYSGVDEWIAELRRLGIKVLRNERVTIGEGEEAFDLAGVDDWSASRFGGDHGANLGRALEGRDETRPLVLLAHQPKQIVEAAKQGVALMLSGHTHGGQIFPWHFFVGIDQPYLAGLATHEATSTQIYVSRGTGYWGPPMRVGAPSEISLLELHPAG